MHVNTLGIKRMLIIRQSHFLEISETKCQYFTAFINILTFSNNVNKIRRKAYKVCYHQ